MSTKREGKIERMPKLGDREHTPQPSIRHVHFDMPDTYHTYTSHPGMSSEPSGSGNVEASSGNTVENAGQVDAGIARSVSLIAVSSAHRSHHHIRTQPRSSRVCITHPIEKR